MSAKYGRIGASNLPEQAVEYDLKNESGVVYELEQKIEYLASQNAQTQTLLKRMLITFSGVLLFIAVVFSFYFANQSNQTNKPILSYNSNSLPNTVTRNNNNNNYNNNNNNNQVVIEPSLNPSSTRSLAPSTSNSLAPSTSNSLAPSTSNSLAPSTSNSLVPVLSPSPAESPSNSLLPSNSPVVQPSSPAPLEKSKSPSYTPAPSQEVIAVIYDGKVWWDGKYDSFPEPITPEFSGPAAPEAVGKKAYMTMITGYGKEDDQYSCLGLTLMTSLSKTNPDPSIDLLVIVLIDDHDDRYKGIKEGTPEFEAITPEEVLGPMFYKALTQAGVNKWIIWRELETEGRAGMAGGWKQAFTKLRFWSLVQYDKVVFLDADTMIFKNLDHLFDEPEFTTAPTWGCINPNSPLKPSGGFWVIHPSLNTWGLIQKYIDGRDPCANKWRLGDMTMTWVLFVDTRELRENTPQTWQQYDGDWTRWGRCQEKNMYPARFDFMHESGGGIYSQRTGVVPKSDMWKMLNESYDILVAICDNSGFYNNPKDDRYNVLRGQGSKMFDRPDKFSVHFSCGHKPRCRTNHQEYNEIGACAKDMFDQWYEMLYTYYRPSWGIRENDQP